MKGLDPVVRAEQVLPRVYNEMTNERLIRRFRLKGRSYGGCLTVDIVGCNMRCTYCYVPGSYLDGQDSREENLLGRETAKGKVEAFSPERLVERCLTELSREPQNIQITAAEPFLTADWLLEVVQRLGPWMRKNKKLLWVDTNGLDLVTNPELFKRLLSFGSFLRLFVSSKNTPSRYTATTRVDVKYADTGFRCLELCWRSGIQAFLQGPICAIFSPDDFEWYFQRLVKIHLMAPLLLDLDRLVYLPLARIRNGLKQGGLWDKRQPDTKVEKLWQEFLEKKYDRKLRRLVSVDYFPKDESLVREFIFEKKPVEKFPLFAR